MKYQQTNTKQPLGKYVISKDGHWEKSWKQNQKEETHKIVTRSLYSGALFFRCRNQAKVFVWLGNMKIKQGNHTNAINGLKYFLLELKDCLIETVGWLNIGDPISSTRVKPRLLKPRSIW